MRRAWLRWQQEGGCGGGDEEEGVAARSRERRQL